jgi:hypothetical protein
VVVCTGVRSDLSSVSGTGAPSGTGRIRQITGQHGALGIHQRVGIIFVELAVTRILHGAVHHFAEEAATIDGDVERIGTGFDIALRELLGQLGSGHTDTGIVARHAVQRVGIQIGKLCLRAFEAYRAGVGDVITDHIQRFGC